MTDTAKFQNSGAKVDSMDGKGNSLAKPNAKVEVFVDKSKEWYCPLCLKDFKMPRILPCLDTFCEECLSADIPNSRIHSGFACPTCRKSTVPPSQGELNKSWPVIFPLNAIIEALGSRDEAKGGEYCNRCNMENGSSTLATSFCVMCKEYSCDGCVKFHMSLKALADDRIIQKNDPYIKLASSLKQVLNCANHPEKHLDQFCKDRNCSRCSICFEKMHQHCSDCLQLSSYAQEKLKHAPPREILLNLRELEKQKIVDESEKILQEASNKIQEGTQRCKSLAASIRLSALILETACNHGTDIQTYLTQQAITKKLDRIKEEVLDNYMRTKAVNIKLKFHQIFHDFMLLSQHQMAELEVRDVDTRTKPSSNVLSSRKIDTHKDKGKQKVPETKKSNDGIYDIELMTTFESHYPVDGMKPRYTGATFLPEGNVVLVDFSNNKCCLYDSDYDFVDDFHFQKNPRTICHVEGKKVAVTIPLSKELETLVIDKGIKCVKTVTTRH
ncbi:hypothetical protein CHS0354_002397 [Potamilus streckersoni]|uniref:RING-type domain-containing protein n=1 Tax=Potamilus streckersoni TaxID=2493646 RepID=A0AAE0RUA3_9BIVA|nr:hypothetical protein CHS0354_002397 [Potamilus streckersoni]